MVQADNILYIYISNANLLQVKIIQTYNNTYLRISNANLQTFKRGSPLSVRLTSPNLAYLWNPTIISKSECLDKSWSVTVSVSTDQCKAMANTLQRKLYLCAETTAVYPGRSFNPAPLVHAVHRQSQKSMKSS